MSMKVSELRGDDVLARDGPAGRVDDGGEVRVHPEYVESIDWAERKVRLLLTRDQVRKSGEAMPRR